MRPLVRVWNHAIDKRPALIVRAASTDDVAQAVGFARSEGRPIAVRGGAHSVAGFSTCDDGVVIDLAQLNDVQVDLEARSGPSLAEEPRGRHSTRPPNNTGWRLPVGWFPAQASAASRWAAASVIWSASTG